MKDRRSAKLDLAAPAAPLQGDAFAALGGLSADALRPAPPEAPVTEPKEMAPAKSKGRLLLRRETKDRGGKTVVVVSGFTPGAHPAPLLEELSRTLRKRLGCGGTVDGREIVVQGDRPAAVAEALRGLGFIVGGVVS
jgi:translation initiation factor 1